MNAPATITRTDAITRELAEIEALETALNDRASSLRKARLWHRQHEMDGLDSSKLRFTLNMDEADRCQADILKAAYDLLEIDAIHAAWLECAA